MVILCELYYKRNSKYFFLQLQKRSSSLAKQKIFFPTVLETLVAVWKNSKQRGNSRPAKLLKAFPEEYNCIKLREMFSISFRIINLLHIPLSVASMKDNNISSSLNCHSSNLTNFQSFMLKRFFRPIFLFSYYQETRLFLV